MIDHLTNTELDVLFGLDLGFTSIKTLSIVTDIPVTHLRKSIKILEALKLVKFDAPHQVLTLDIKADGLKASINSRISASKATETIDRLHVQNLCNELPVDKLVNLYEKAGRENEALPALLSTAQKEFKNYNLKMALSTCRNCLLYLKDRLNDRDACDLYLDAALLFSDISSTLRQGYQEITKILDQAKKVALRLGDRRRLAMVHFHYGRAAMLLNLLDEVIVQMDKGFDLISDINDKDLSVRVSGFRSYYFFSQGLCRDLVEIAEKSLLFSDKYDFPPDPIVATNIAMASAYRGNIYQAVGSLDCIWKRSIHGELGEWTQMFVRAVLGQMLLMCGKMPEAYAHLMEASKAAQASGDPSGSFWSQRALAYYYFLKGRFNDSYKILERCISDTRKSEFPGLFFGVPWFLEMLSKYNYMGYDPIPGCEYSEIIKNALKGPNLLLKGVALRIRAMEIKERATETSDVKELLLKSEFELKRAGALFEVTKTRVELALLELEGKRIAAAKQLASQAWENWPSHEVSAFPPELKALIENEMASIVKGVWQKNLLARYMKMTEEIMSAEGVEELKHKLLTATCHFFEAERGGIFMAENHGKSRSLKLINGLNLVASQTQEKLFAASMATIRKTYEAWEPISVSLPAFKDDPHFDPITNVLCLPVQIGEENKLVLYYDARYTRSFFEILEDNLVYQLVNHLESIIQLSLKTYSLAKEKSAAILRQITMRKGSPADTPDVFGKPFQHLIQMADQIALSDASVVILGETGTGKSVLARRIHDKSQRNDGPFVAIDLSSIPENLLESEIFGHEKGAFTGADNQKQGLMEIAHNGTLFLDEIGEIPKSVQLKLLRSIENKSFVRIGGIVKRTADFRLITATNRDLVKEMSGGSFREDLYYRICVVPFIIPPLRERGNDVIVLAQKFLTEYAHKYHRTWLKLSASDITTLKNYPWPGNIRELKNVIERSVLLSTGDDLRLALGMTHPTQPGTDFVAGQANQALAVSDKPTLDELQLRYINQILKETAGKISGPSGAAAILGMKRSTLQHRIKKLSSARKPKE